MTEPHIRKVAAHRIIYPNGQTTSISVVHIKGIRVVDVQPLKSEKPLTEWLPGTISIKTNNQNIPYATYKGQLLKAK